MALMAVFRRFFQLSALLLCQVTLFRFRKKTALATSPSYFQTGLSGRESVPGAREKSEHRFATRVAGDRILLSFDQGL
jgi:hypothetical protein